MPPRSRRDYLERLIMGLEQSIETQKWEIPHYKPDDVQLKYAKKFMASMEEQLQQAKAELAALPPDEPAPGS